LEWLKQNSSKIDFVFHMGACSTTTESDADYLFDNNVHYSVEIFRVCTEHEIPLVYASSAATYGNGEAGYDDDHNLASSLRPNNKYGYSKYFFDQWMLQQKKRPPLFVGLKFFNVYGPNEYHKGGQASVVYHAFPQVRDRQALNLFKSYEDRYADGEQKRDFVYVKDVVQVMSWFYEHRHGKHSGIFNVGTGVARSFLELGKAVFTALDMRQPKFDFIEMPESLRKQYQYFTEAKLDRLRVVGGYQKPFMSIEDGVRDYVQGYLSKEDPYL
jgi:ADP-L-glycero-D-manno-heptose 6-epimerase